MSQPDFDAILQKYLAGNCTPAEEKIVLDWYETFITQSEIPLSPQEKIILEQKIWAKVEAGTTGYHAVIPVYHRLWFRAVAAACILAIVVGGYWYFQKDSIPANLAFHNISIPQGYTTVYNHNDTIQFLTISDGTSIQLQPQSVLYFPAKFTGTTREVYLGGNAFFRVAHDTAKHFIVHTDEGLTTEVLGTSFYVLHDEPAKKVEVAVVTGRVSVYEQKERDKKQTLESGIILTPNQKVLYTPVNKQFVTALVDEPKPLEQLPGIKNQPSFIFDDAPLKNVLKVLETAYGITIHPEDQKLGNCHFTGDLAKQSLYEKLDIICKSLQISYEVKGTAIYVSGKGCSE